MATVHSLELSHWEVGRKVVGAPKPCAFLTVVDAEEEMQSNQRQRRLKPRCHVCSCGEWPRAQPRGRLLGLSSDSTYWLGTARKFSNLLRAGLPIVKLRKGQTLYRAIVRIKGENLEIAQQGGPSKCCVLRRRSLHPALFPQGAVSTWAPPGSVMPLCASHTSSTISITSYCISLVFSAIISLRSQFKCIAEGTSWAECIRTHLPFHAANGGSRPCHGPWLSLILLCSLTRGLAPLRV